MAIVFPASPSVNDTFTAGSITYKWDGAKWIGLGVTPADRLVEGSNSLEINASNDLVWTGGNLLVSGGGKLCVGTTLTGFGTLQIRDASGDSTTSAIQVENPSAGTDQTNVVLRSVSLNSGAWANAEYRAKSHVFSYQSTPIVTVTENGIVMGGAKGIDFSANGNAAGMTSEVLNDYEEGTWTPDIDNAYITTPGTTYNSRAGKYVKIGKMVLARFTMNIAGLTNSGVGPLFFGGLPFTHDTSDISHRGLQASLYISGPNTPTGAVNVNLGYAVLDNGNYYLTLSTPIDDQASNNSRVIQAADLSNGDVISGTIMYIST